MAIKLCIVDDHKIVRDGLKLFLSDDNSVEVMSEAGSLTEMFDVLENKNCDVILLDFKLPDGDGINGALKIKRLYPSIKVILITAFIDPDIVSSALSAPIDGIVFKSVEETALSTIIREVYAGTYNARDYLPKHYFENEDDYVQYVKFSPREQKILNELTLGKTNSEIADALHIAEKTVRNNLHSIFKKIHVSNRTEASAYWLKSKIKNRDK